MSQSTKKKHVVKELLEGCSELSPSQLIVKILLPRGNYLYEVETINKDQFLVSMPNKFRNTVFIKRNDFVIIEEIKEGDRVKGEIVNVLLKRQIKQMKKQGIWPKEFDDGPDLDENTGPDDTRFPDGIEV